MTDWSDPTAWYDIPNAWGPSDEFYLGLVMGADRVLDIGCGTGMLLHHARDAGHKGRLCGLDPDPAMLRHAQRRTDIEWILSDAASAAWDGAFDLAVMTGHAFQVFVTDETLRASLAAIRCALVPGGRFAFETRHPQARAWESWDGWSYEAQNPDGEVVEVSYEVLDVSGDVVRLTETFAGKWWDVPHVDEGKLRFLSPDALDTFLEEAGFAVDERFGTWERGPVTDASEEIVTVARRK